MDLNKSTGLDMTSLNMESINTTPSQNIVINPGKVMESDLKSQLLSILAENDFLPLSPQDAIYGTSLLTKVRGRLGANYSDNSIKNYFSAFSKDSQSPIAKVSGGFGYFRRTVPENVTELTEENSSLNVVGDYAGNIVEPVNIKPRDEQLEEKFRALYMRWIETEDKFPVHIEHTKSTKSVRGANKWKFPDVVVLDWEVLEDNGQELDRTLLGIKKSLGDRPFSISSIELKVDINFSNLREYFFQCVSNSKWANEAHLVIACGIFDEQLEEELRRLGSSFNVSVTSFGLEKSDIENLASADKLSLENEEILAQKYTKIKRIFSNKSNESLDWEHIKDLRAINPDFNAVFHWISRCLKDEKPYSHTNFIGIEDAELQALQRQIEEMKRR